MNLEEILQATILRETPRGHQKAIGPSEIMGCQRKVWLQLHEAPKVNQDRIKLKSWLGTAIHHYLEYQLSSDDPFDERWMLEVEVEHQGLMGHVDVYDKKNLEVIDWKSTEKKNLGRFPSSQQRTQVQLYGWLLTNNGYPVENVSLVCIPRDGTEFDIKVHTEPYSEAIALEGLAWLSKIVDMVDAPAPDKPARIFCAPYCEFYDPSGEKGCEGKR